MRIEQLEYLIEIEKTKSMNIASVNMNISPQALGAGIKSLEKELGVSLTDKSSRGTELNELGKQIANITEEYLYNFHKLINQHAEKEKINKIFCPIYCLDADSFATRLGLDISHLAEKNS